MSRLGFIRLLAFLVSTLGVNNVPAEAIVINTLAKDLEINTDSLYWSDPGEFPILKLPTAGGDVTPLTRRIGVPVSITIRDGILVWVDSRTGYTPSCTGPGVIRILNQTILATGLTSPLSVGVDCAGTTTDLVTTPRFVYWSVSTVSPEEYRILRVNRETGAVATLVKTPRPIVSMARDASHLYWMEQNFPDPGAIRRKPLAGGAGELVVKAPIPLLNSFAVTGTDVVYALLPYPMYSKAEIYRVPVIGGTPSKIVETTPIPRKIAATDTQVVWIDETSLHSADLSGGSASLVAGDLDSPVDLLLSADRAYWLETVCCAHGQKGTLRTVGLQGGEVTTLAGNLNAPERLATGAGWLYWTEGGPIGLIEGFGRVARLPLAGGVAKTVVSGISAETPTPNISVAKGYVYAADRFAIKRMPTAPGKTEVVAVAGNPVADLVSDGIHVYWTDEIFGSIYRAPVAGGAIELLSTSPTLGPGSRIRLAGNYVYWMDHFDTLRRVPKTGGPTTTIAASLPFLSDFVVGAQVFFSEWDTGDIRKIPLSGGAIASVLDFQCWPSPCSLAQSATNIYWVNQNMVGTVPKIGGTAMLLSNTGGSPFDANAIILDDTYVYWSDTFNLTINRVPRADQ